MLTPNRARSKRCAYCSEDAEPGRKHCRKHLIHQRQAQKRYRTKLTDRGLCIKCRAPLPEGRAYLCRQCQPAEMGQIERRRKRQERIAAAMAEYLALIRELKAEAKAKLTGRDRDLILTRYCQEPPRILDLRTLTAKYGVCQQRVIQIEGRARRALDFDFNSLRAPRRVLVYEIAMEARLAAGRKRDRRRVA
jgi:hypothetical protein